LRKGGKPLRDLRTKVEHAKRSSLVDELENNLRRGSTTNVTKKEGETAG